MPNDSLALERRLVKHLGATQAKDSWDRQSCRPNVLRRMPLSCNVVFDVLRSLAGGEAVEVGLRELAEMTRYSTRQVRRALRRLEAAHLIRWETFGPGRGHRSVFQTLWRSPSFPHLKGASPTRARYKDPPSGKEVYSFPRKTPAHAGGSTAASPQKTFQLKGQKISPRAERWALAEFRRRLAKWTPEAIAKLDGVADDGQATYATGLDHQHVLQAAKRRGLEVWEGELGSLGGPDREEAMLAAAKEIKRAVVSAFAIALHRAIKRERIRTGRELAQVVERVAETLNEEAQDWLWPWLSERMAIDGERAAYAWVGRLVRAAVAGIEEARAVEEARRREAEERARIRAEWQALEGRSLTRELLAQVGVSASSTPTTSLGPVSPGRGSPTFSSGQAGPSPHHRGVPSAPGFRWQGSPDGRTGYWVLGGGQVEKGREVHEVDRGAARATLARLERELLAAEAVGDHLRAKQAFEAMVKLRRALQVFRPGGNGG